MPPRDDRILLTDREWTALIANMETLQKTVEKLEREQLVFKAKLAVWMVIFGSVSGLIMSVATEAIIKIFIK